MENRALLYRCAPWKPRPIVQVCTFENRARHAACQMCQSLRIPPPPDRTNGHHNGDHRPTVADGRRSRAASTDRWTAVAGTGAARPASAASLMQPARVQSRDMEKLRRREERDARHTWSRVVDYCATNQVSTVLPTGRLFG